MNVKFTSTITGVPRCLMGRTSADVVALRTSSSIKSHGSISRFGYGDPALTMALTMQTLGVCIKSLNDDGDSM